MAPKVSCCQKQMQQRSNRRCQNASKDIIIGFFRREGAYTDIDLRIFLRKSALQCVGKIETVKNDLISGNFSFKKTVSKLKTRLNWHKICIREYQSGQSIKDDNVQQE